MTMTIIESRGLARTFRLRKSVIRAVDGIDLSIAAGEIVGFLGPNGAGKTTTLRMLTTLLRPTAGSARIAGLDLRTAPGEVRRQIGLVAQAGGTDSNCLVAEEVMLQAALHGMDRAACRRRTAFLLGQLDLGDLARRRVKTLSGGQRRRLDIAVGMAHQPRVLFLDEPTAGLDPQSRKNLWEHIRRLRSEAGTTVFITTHYLDEADALCDRILVIDHGRIVAEDTPEGLKRQVSGDVINIALEDADPEVAGVLLSGLPGVRDVAPLGGRTLRLAVDHNDQTVIHLMTMLRGAGLSVRGLQLTRPSLEDVFLTLTGDAPRES